MELPKRKHTRLKNYDYSLPGYYYVTIHASQGGIRFSEVRRGILPNPAEVKLLEAGLVAQRQLFALQERYPYVKIDQYVIMPTHIHAIICLEGGGSPEARPSLTDIICAYKSLTARQINQQMRTPGRKVFQTSFYETVLRNKKAYEECWKYIAGNPEKWLLNPED